MNRDVIRFVIGTSSLGSVLVGSSHKGICAILLGRDPDGVARELRDRFPSAQLIAAGDKLGQLSAAVVDFVEAPALGLDLALDVRGTAFQLGVWQALGEIVVGSTASYSEIARRMGASATALEVAQACASNAIAVAIPCHRVVARTAGSRATDGVSGASVPCFSGRPPPRQITRLLKNPQDAQKGPDARRRPTAAREA